MNHTYRVRFSTDDGSTGEMAQPGITAIDAARAVDRGYRHIAVCADGGCACHNRAIVYLDGWPVREPTARHAGAVYYQVGTPDGLVTVKARYNRVSEV